MKYQAGMLIKNGNCRNYIIIAMNNNYYLLMDMGTTEFLVCWNLEGNIDNCYWGQGYYFSKDIEPAMVLYKRKTGQ